MEYQPPDTLLEGFWGVFCVLFVVFSVLKGYRTQHQLLLAIPSVSPIPPSRLTPLCPFWLDNTQALYATCPSARLYLGEPRSLGLELPLLGFWPCPPPPPFPLLCVSLSHSSLFPFAPCCPLQTQTPTVAASVRYFIHLNACTEEDHGHRLPLPVTCGLDTRYLGGRN